jgi:hypothetical protein
MKDAMVCQNDEKAKRPKALETQSAKKPHRCPSSCEQFGGGWINCSEF